MNKTFNVTIEKTHEFQASVASTLVRSDSSYKGDFEFISDLQNIIAYNGDYADVFETNSRWVYENNQWVNTDKEILINPLSVEIVQVTGQSTTAVISQKGTTDAIATAKQEVNTYADTQDIATLATAKTYADMQDTTNLASAKSYTDTKIANLDYSEVTGTPKLGTVASKDTGTGVGDIPIIGADKKIGRYLVPNADGNLLGTVAGLPFGNATTKAGATYTQIIIGDAGDAYAYYPKIDTAMSGSSINLVQNKVVKAYVDTAITTAISDTWGGSY